MMVTYWARDRAEKSGLAAGPSMSDPGSSRWCALSGSCRHMIARHTSEKIPNFCRNYMVIGASSGVRKLTLGGR